MAPSSGSGVLFPEVRRLSRVIAGLAVDELRNPSRGLKKENKFFSRKKIFFSFAKPEQVLWRCDGTWAVVDVTVQLSHRLNKERERTSNFCFHSTKNNIFTSSLVSPETVLDLPRSRGTSPEE